MRRFAISAGLTAAAAAVFGTLPAVAQSVEAAPQEGARYVVVLKNGTVADPVSVARSAAGIELGSVYRSALEGFSAELTPTALAALRANPNVAYVEKSAVAHAHGQATPNGTARIGATANSGLKVGDGRDERVDVDVAVIDSGIDYTHPDLHVVRRVNCVAVTSCVENAGMDDNGHGSNVAGIVGGLDNGIGYVGVAPGARLWSVKSLNSKGSGSTEEIVYGIDWVTAHADEIEVVNLSLGFDGTVQAVNDAVTRAIAKGIVVVVSAGNDKRDVAEQSPANVADAITVSSLSDGDGKPGGLGDFAWCNAKNTNKDDTLSNFSNFGRGVDLAAPGDCIRSASKDGGYSNYSGTSQAAPHVAGAAGWLTRGSAKPTNRAGVLALRDRLVATGSATWTDTSGDGAKEPLLDVTDTAAYPAGGTTAPQATFVSDCDRATRACTFDASLTGGSGPSYRWDFGDGTTGSGVKPIHTYAAYGTYTVKLTVTDASGRTGRNQTTFRLLAPNHNDKPTAKADGFCTVNGHCSLNSAGSYDPDGTLASYSWNFGDGTTGTGSEVSHQFPAGASGTYRTTLTVTDDKGGTGSASATVTCTKQQWYMTCSID
ncbi:S8 family serine peptidase [Streptomyces sp. SBC-4]|nr:S8 family serine peptidase [Streptomyces sp. SBC-4]MDV5143995.1 S8 family serine peptidase [Streptomyces sp. SBC-4]